MFQGIAWLSKKLNKFQHWGPFLAKHLSSILKITLTGLGNRKTKIISKISKTITQNAWYLSHSLFKYVFMSSYESELKVNSTLNSTTGGGDLRNHLGDNFDTQNFGSNKYNPFKYIRCLKTWHIPNHQDQSLTRTLEKALSSTFLVRWDREINQARSICIPGATGPWFWEPWI